MEQDMSQYQGPVLFYNETVIDHFKNPRNVGEMDLNETSGFATVGDPGCGDELNLWIKVENNIIVDIKFKTFGCPSAIATSSMTTVLAKGKTLEEAEKLTDDDIITALEGIPEKKQHCSLLGINAIRKAIQDYRESFSST